MNAKTIEQEAAEKQFPCNLESIQDDSIIKKGKIELSSGEI